MAEWPGTEVKKKQEWPGQEVKTPESAVPIGSDPMNPGRAADLEVMSGERQPQPKSMSQVGSDLLEGVPMAARAAGGFGGGMLGAPGGPVTAIAGGVLGSELLGQAADIGVDYLKGRPVKSPIQRGTEAVSNIFTDLVTQGLMAGSTSLLQKIRSGMVKQNAAKVMDDLVESGLQPRNPKFFQGDAPNATAPLIGDRGVQRAAETTQKLYFGGDVWNDAIKNTQDDFAKSFERTRSAVGTATEKSTGGDAIISGIDSYAKRSGVIANRLYDRVRGLDKIDVNISETQLIAKKLLEQNQNGLNDPATRSVLEDIISRPRLQTAVNKAQVVSFAEARALRSDLLSIARQQNSLMANKAESAGKLLAKTLGDDIDRAATALDPAQYTRWQKANAFYKQRATALEAVDQIWKSDTAQQAYNSAVQGAADGPAKLMALKKVVPRDQWDEFTAVMLNQLGLEGKGAAQEGARQFSPQAFLSNYANLSPGSRNVMFGDQTALRSELDRLARVAGYIRDTKAVANPSGTAGSLLSYGQAAGAGGAAVATFTGSPILGPIGVLAPTAGVYGTSKLMTSPRFVKWLADGANLPPANPNALKQHLTRLATIATVQPELRQDIAEYLDSKRVKK